jgi:uncharacterized 2Fe-2S/4Fe-4S cluster protein (DUF4445 family)
MAADCQLSIDIQPLGRRAAVRSGATVLAALRAAGIELFSVCGGQGRCGTCRVCCDPGALAAPTELEVAILGRDELSRGARLACQARLEASTTVEVPPGSLPTLQRLQVEGELTRAIPLDPAAACLDVDVPRPTPHDVRSDATRLLDTVALAGLSARLSLDVVRSAPRVLRAEAWAVRAVVHRSSSEGSASEVVTLLPKGTVPLGAAVDVGTTKLAAYLVDLGSGEVVARGAASNPQVALGEDVMSRIAYAGTVEGGETELHVRLVEGVNRLLAQLLDKVGATTARVVDAVAVGNTAMHHSLANFPLRQLGCAPYVPAVADAVEVRGADLGLEVAPGALLYLPPNIAGFVGADHTAALLATGTAKTHRTVLLVDIGTNTEITVAHSGQLWTCSCASGPAFEGAHIRDGMRAAEGAVERVSLVDGQFQVQTIGGRRPSGICGSGILDAVAAALRAGAVRERGGLLRGHPLVGEADGVRACVLVPGSLTAHGRDIALTREDVGEVQLAKAAIRAGTELLLSAAGIAADDLEEVVIAGAFGTYLDPDSAVAIGMLPSLPRHCYRQVGNAAGQGAQQLLISRSRRREAAAVAKRAQYIELTTHQGFANAFADQLSFGQGPASPAQSKEWSA